MAKSKTAQKPKDEAAADQAAEAAPAPFKPGLENLIGETADEMLADMKAAAQREPWEKLDQETQRGLIDNAKERARVIVQGVVEAISTKGFPHYVASVSKYSGKMGGRTVQLSLEIPAQDFEPERLHGETVLVFASAKDFGAEPLTRPTPNEPPLIPQEDADQVDSETGEVIEDAAPAEAPSPGR